MRLCFRFFVIALIFTGLAHGQAVRLHVDGTLAPPAAHGLAALQKALGARGVQWEPGALPATGQALVVGVATPGSQLSEWIKAGRMSLPDSQEALSVKRLKEGQAELLCVAGSDAMGVEYALLEIAEEIEALPPDADWFTSIKELSEKPANAMRRMRVMLHHEANEEDTYLSPEYWDWYLDLLVKNRFNALNLVFSHQTSYMAPMYPWHIRVPGFENVKVKGLSEERRQKNLAALQTISKKCQERGLEFTLGVWQQLPWMEAFVGTRENQPIYVEGLNPDNAREYVYAAMKELLAQVPGVARVQLRCNDESGVPYDIQTRFYKETALKAIGEASPPVKIELRIAKGTTIDAARAMDRGLRLSTKYYGEFMGQPYTPLEVNTRGYSYDERMRHPFVTPVFNEIWVLGSHRIFLWGSEDYGRRFGRMASYGGSVGFETDGPMAQKGYRDPYSPAWRLFKNKESEYYRWEMERYWAFFRAIGRFSYNPDTDHEVWMRPFRARFGEQADLMAKAYESASRVIGLIVASHINNINMYVWPEKSMGGVLGVYMDERGSDKGLFPSINEFVAAELAGAQTGRIGPLGLAREFEEIADGVENVFARNALAPLETSKEFVATRADFQMMAALARYHAARQRECYRMARFFGTGDVSETVDAAREAEYAVRMYRALVEKTDKWYYDKMQFAPVENGHWKNCLFLVEKEPQFVQDAVDVLHTYGLFDYGFDFGGPPKNNRYTIFSFWKYANRYDMEPRFTGLSTHSRYDAQTGYGWLQSDGMTATAMPLISSRQLTGEDPAPDKGLPRDALYADFVESSSPMAFRIDLPMTWHRLTFVFADKSAKPTDHGPLDVMEGGNFGPWPYQRNIEVPAGQVVHYQEDVNVRGSWYPFTEVVVQPSEKGGDAILSGLVVSASRPRLAHAPLFRIDPSKDATINVTITMPPSPDASGNLSAKSAGQLASAELLWRSDPAGAWQHANLASKDGFSYSASLKPGGLSGRWLEYKFVASDQFGHTSQLPERGHGYFARLTADQTAPAVEHTAIASTAPGKDMTLRAKVSDPDGVAVVRAYYRPMQDQQPYECIEMEKQGDEYVATIPGRCIVPEFDFIYYLEAVDEAGNGRIYPDWETAVPYVIVPVR